jgi:hypothetical protein
MQKRLLLLYVLLIFIVGCVSVPKPISGENPFIYPKSDFISEEKFTSPYAIEDNQESSDNNGLPLNNNYDFFSECLGISSNELDVMLSDPFLKTKDMPCVTFDGYYAPAKVIAKYYQNKFNQHGWHKVRDMYVVEQCNGGGDWIRVYGKSDALVRIHIMGAWNFYRDEKEFKQDRVPTRMIQFWFIGMKPSDLLGNDYKKKLVELNLM